MEIKETLASKPYSANPGDHYLSVVLCKVDGARPYVTWMKNSEDKGFHSGHYFETLEGALHDFNNRP